MSLTRERVLERLRVAPATLKELAQEMGLSRVAVHRHLSSLMARGLVQAELRRCPRQGRPYRVYWAQDPEAPYVQICLEVLDHLGPEGVEEVLKKRKERLSQTLLSELKGLPLKERAERLVRHLNREGYAAEVVEEEGRVYLIQRRCPKLALASRYAAFCEAELSLYRGLLGPVERESRIVDGERVCRYRLR